MLLREASLSRLDSPAFNVRHVADAAYGKDEPYKAATPQEQRKDDALQRMTVSALSAVRRESFTSPCCISGPLSVMTLPKPLLMLFVSNQITTHNRIYGIDHHDGLFV